MGIPAVIIGLVLIAITLTDAFEAMISPRRVTRHIRPTRVFYALVWPPWAWIGRHIAKRTRREAFLSIFGPASLLNLFFIWALLILAGFALVQWGGADPIRDQQSAFTNLWTYFYLSGVTLFTLGYGDVAPLTPLGRALSTTEAGLGLAFLAAIISYLPTLYQAFSSRETIITLLDARAGSPPLLSRSSPAYSSRRASMRSTISCANGSAGLPISSRVIFRFPSWASTARSTTISHRLPLSLRHSTPALFC